MSKLETRFRDLPTVKLWRIFCQAERAALRRRNEGTDLAFYVAQSALAEMHRRGALNSERRAVSS